MARFSYDVETSDGKATVTLHGELDMAATLQLEPEVDRLLSEGIRSLTVDLGALTFIDSTGISLLVSLTERVRTAQAELVLLRPQEAVGRALEVTGVDSVLPLV